MSKVAIITDTHWGARNDSLVFVNFYKKFYDGCFFPKLDGLNIRTVLMLGDTFDRRKYTNHVSLHHAKEIYFDELHKRGITVHMLAGNHDCAYKNTNMINSPDLFLREYSNVNVIDSPKTITVDGLDLCMIPWICSDNYESSMEEMQSTRSEICMGHFEIADFSMYRGIPSHGGMPKSVFKKFDMVFSGHYHHRSDDGHIYYLGNPYELTWQDYNDPRGFHIFDTETRSLEFIQNPNSIFFKLEYNDYGKEPVDLDVLDLQDCYVKLVVVNKTNHYKFDLFCDKLYNKGCSDIKIIEDLSEFNDGELADDVQLEDTMDVLCGYIDSVETQTDKNAIKDFMKSLYVESLHVQS